MKVLILKDADLPSHVLTKGSLMEVDDKYATEWIAAGIAEEASTPAKRTATKKPTREVRTEDAA